MSVTTHILGSINFDMILLSGFSGFSRRSNGYVQRTLAYPYEHQFRRHPKDFEPVQAYQEYGGKLL